MKNRLRYDNVYHLFFCIDPYLCKYDHIQYFNDSYPHTRIYVWPIFFLYLFILTTIGCSPREVWNQVWSRFISRVVVPWSRYFRHMLYVYLCTWQNIVLCMRHCYVSDIMQYHSNLEMTYYYYLSDIILFSSAMYCLIYVITYYSVHVYILVLYVILAMRNLIVLVEWFSLI